MTDRYQELRDAIAAGAVLVVLQRPEGYEDVHPEIMIDDAAIHPTFAPEHVGAELAALLKERDALRDALERALEVGSHLMTSKHYEQARAALADGEKA